MEETSRASQTPGSENPREPIVSGNDSRNLYFPKADLLAVLSGEDGNALPASMPSSVGMFGANNDTNRHTEPNRPLLEFGDFTMSSQNSGSASLDWALIHIRETALQTFRDFDRHAPSPGLLSSEPNKPLLEFGDLAMSSQNSGSASLLGFDSDNETQLQISRDPSNHGPSPRILSVDRAAQISPQDSAIVALTGSGNMLKGTLSGTPTYLHFPQTKTFQEVWTVTLNGKLANGDCGPWVLDAKTGVLNGHIVSGNPKSGTAYIVPAYQVFKDLGQQFGSTEIELYTGIEAPLKPALITDHPQEEVFIAIMGPTGTGKTTFINDLTGANLAVGHSLESCM